jgi:hypothetical protein
MGNDKPEAEQEPVLQLSDIACLLTRGKANQGVKVPLRTESGQLTDQWILVRHVHCDEYRARSAEFVAVQAFLSARAATRLKGGSIEFSGHEMEKVNLEMRASLVGGWSEGIAKVFGECTHEAAMKLLQESPLVQDAVVVTANNGANFFDEPQIPSSPGPSGNSGSEENPPQAQDGRSENP